MLEGVVKGSKSNDMRVWGFQRPSNAFLGKAGGPLLLVVAGPASHQAVSILMLPETVLV